MKIVTALSAGLFATLSGCATEPIPASAAQSVSMENRLLYVNEGPDTVPVQIVRDSGLMGAMFAVKVLVNDRVAAYVGNGEKVTLHIPPGEVILGAEMGLSPLVEVEANLQLGRPRTYRIGVHQNGVSLSPTSVR